MIITLWVGRMSLFLGATSYTFKSDKTHDDCNLNGSEKNIERGRERGREGDIKRGNTCSQSLNLVVGVSLYYSFNLSSGLKFLKIKSW